MATIKVSQLQQLGATLISTNDLLLLTNTNAATSVALSIAALDFRYTTMYGLSLQIGFSQITGQIGLTQMPQSSALSSGYLSSTDWTTFNSKLNSFSADSAVGLTLNGLTLTVATADASHIGVLSSADWSSFNSKASAFSVDKTNGLTLNGTTLSLQLGGASLIGAIGFSDFNVFNAKQGALTADNAKGVTITGSTITVATADSSHIGVLSSTDWTTFNSKAPSFTADTAAGMSLSGSTLTQLVASNSQNGYLSSTDHTSFAAKQAAVTFDVAKGITNTGSTVTIATATTSLIGVLSSTDWNTFNGKQAAITFDKAQGLTNTGTTVTIQTFGTSLLGVVPASPGGSVNYLRADATWGTPAGSGTVTSVAITVPSFLSVSGTPVTSSGTFVITANTTGTSNVVLSNAPTFTGTVSGASATWTGTDQAAVFQTATATPATAGIVRLSDGDTLDWRNHANSANIPLGKDTSDSLYYNTTIIMDKNGNFNFTNTVPAGSFGRTQLNSDTNAGLVKAWGNFRGITLAGTYGRSGTTVTVTMTAHGMSTGQLADLTFSAGTGGTATSGTYVITSTGANSFTITDTASGTITGSPAVTRNTWVRANYNITSVKRNGTGDYTINFTNAMTDANYILMGGPQLGGAGAVIGINTDNLTQTTSAIRIYTLQLSNNVAVDVNLGFFSILGN